MKSVVIKVERSPNLRSSKTDIEALFIDHDCFGSIRSSSYPFIALTPHQNEVKLQLLTNPYEVLSLPDETVVLVQWPGTYRSDFFQFTIAEAKAWRATRDPRFVLKRKYSNLGGKWKYRYLRKFTVTNNPYGVHGIKETDHKSRANKFNSHVEAMTISSLIRSHCWEVESA